MKLVEEYKTYLYLRERDAQYQHPPIYNMVEGVIVQSGHVLLTRKATRPGMGLLCLPGGYLDPILTIRDSLLKNINQQIKIKIPPNLLANTIKDSEDFDYPWRSERGRVISKTFLLKLPETANGLPNVKCQNDTISWAGWLPIFNLKSEDLFEDRYHIIMRMIEKIKRE